MITALAHTAVCVNDLDAAVDWYTSVLGLRVLAPAYRMEGDEIERDMGELIPSPVVVRAAIVGVDAGDNVLEVIEYPSAPTDSTRRRQFRDEGISHIGLLCDDIDATRRHLEQRGATFLTSGIADVARLRTAWFEDPWGVVFILMQKRRHDRAYWAQFGHA